MPSNGHHDPDLVFAFRLSTGPPHLTACAETPEAALLHLQRLAARLYAEVRMGEGEERLLELLAHACRPDGLRLR